MAVRVLYLTILLLISVCFESLAFSFFMETDQSTLIIIKSLSKLTEITIKTFGFESRNKGSI